MAENQPLDLNTASREALIALPGIGEVLAERIIAARPLRSLDDLRAIPGMRESVLERLRPLVTVNGAATTNALALPAAAAETAEAAGKTAEAAEDTVEDAAEATSEAAEAVAENVAEEAEEAAETAEETVQAAVEDVEEATEKVASEAEDASGDEDAPAVEEAPEAAAEAEEGPAQPSSNENYITRRGAWAIALTSALAAFLLAFALSLGVLQAINGTLSYADAARYRTTERHVQAVQEQLGQLQASVDALQRQVSDLKALAVRLDQLEDTEEELQLQIDDLSQTVEEIQINTSKFDVFLTGLQDLLMGLNETLPADVTPTPEP